MLLLNVTGIRVDIAHAPVGGGCNVMLFVMGTLSVGSVAMQ